jgi:undecaprenyl-diphosphatase
MLTSFTAFILGIVEGVAEFLPISSTAHLILTSHFLGIHQTDEHILFEIAIQLGAILAVVILFWKEFLSIQKLKKLAYAFIPTGLAGFLIYPYIKALFQSPFFRNTPNR